MLEPFFLLLSLAKVHVPFAGAGTETGSSQQGVIPTQPAIPEVSWSSGAAQQPRPGACALRVLIGPSRGYCRRGGDGGGGWAITDTVCSMIAAYDGALLILGAAGWF